VAYLGGKMLGLVLAIAAVWVLVPLLHSSAHAQTATDAAPTGQQFTDVVNATNTAWTLIAAFLVFFMQAGFMMLEAGFARTREVVNILQECIVDTCLCALLFWAFCFALWVGYGNGFIGHTWFFLNNAPATYSFAPGTDTGVAF